MSKKDPSLYSIYYIYHDITIYVIYIIYDCARSVSWVRVRDGHILTVDQEVFTSDTRVSALVTRRRNVWSLRSVTLTASYSLTVPRRISGVLEADEGQYECQVSTEAKLSSVFNVKVVRPQVSWNLYLDLNLIMMDRDFIIEYGMVRRFSFSREMEIYFHCITGPAHHSKHYITTLYYCYIVTL